ncbi:YfgG family protein [Photorhabdus viridis]|uniref:YfgG family protein n=1 Tax=Photorhabdus viridis TaxID=3163327 RepID=UPI003306DC2E
MKKKKRSQITKLVLLISFLILFGRFIYSSIAALDHHQQSKQTTIEKNENHHSPAPFMHMNFGFYRLTLIQNSMSFANEMDN